MKKKILIGAASLLGVFFVVALIILHSSEGKEVVDLMRQIHGK